MVKVLAMTNLRPDETEALEIYMKTVLPLVENAGGELIDRYEVEETIVGDDGPKFLSIIDYPSKSAAQSVFQSKAYKDIEEFRDRAFSSYTVFFLS